MTEYSRVISFVQDRLEVAASNLCRASRRHAFNKMYAAETERISAIFELKQIISDLENLKET